MLVSSDTAGEIVYESEFDTKHLPQMIVELIMELRYSVYVSKTEVLRGNTPWEYDKKYDYTIKARSYEGTKEKYLLGNIAIEYV